MYLLNEKRQVKGIVVFLLVFALLVTGCVGPLVTTAMAGGPSVAEQLGINTEKETEVPDVIGDVSEKEVNLLGEDIELRSKYIKQFVREDKATQAVIYEQAVHYEEDGVFKDINNTLVLNRGEKGAEVYRNRDNGYYNVSLNPNENTKGDTILMEREGGSLSWKLVSVNTGEKQALTRQSGEKTVEILSNGIAERKSMASRNEQMMMLENLTSGARYSNVYKGVSLEYFMMPEKVKENIVLDSYINNAEFVFNLSMTNLDAKQSEDGMIVLINTKTGEEVFYIEAPYMIDAKMEYSADVKMALVQDCGKTQLVITPSDEWLKKAAYPVKIDPTVVTDIAVANIRDACVSEGDPNNNFQTGTILKVGEGSSSQTNYTFIKFNNLPTIDSSHMIVDSDLYLNLKYNTNQDNVQVNVHKVNGSWDSSSIKWSNMPGYNSIIEDYEIVSTINTSYSWEITDIARTWYQTGNNYGLMLRETPNDNDYIEFFSSDSSGIRPYATITYVSNAGLESYWTYHSQSAGRAGTGYVNDYNGNLIWVHNDLSMNGNRMPVSLSHVFNSCYKGADSYFLGKGWRLNLNEHVGSETISGVKYFTYWDTDGTKHYFYNDNGTWKVESGLDFTLDPANPYNGGNFIKIKDKNDNFKIFHTFDGSAIQGKLRYIVDRNGNVQRLNYTSGKLTSVVDGAGRTTYLYYNGTGGRLSQIKDPSNRSTRFYYDSNGRLQYIQYPDHTSSAYRKTQFTYDSNGDLTEAKNFDGYEINYDYSNAQPHRVKSIDENNGSTTGGNLNLNYGGNSTTYTDGSGRAEYLHFDDYGRTVGGVNDHGQGVYYDYHTGTNDINNNKITGVSKMQDTVVNLIRNGNMELSSDWSLLSSTGSTGTHIYTETESYFGGKSLQLHKTNTTKYEYAKQVITLEKGETYTLSGYMKTENVSSSSRGAYFRASYKNSAGTTVSAPIEKVTGTTDWEKYSVTFTVPSDAATPDVTIYCFVRDSTGKAWFDGLQLEEGEVANKFNWLENNDFDGTVGGYPEGGYYGFYKTSEDGLVALSGRPGSSNNLVYKIAGDASLNKALVYNLNFNGKAGDVFTASAWAKADALPKNYFHLIVKFHNLDGTSTHSRMPFNIDNSDWQFVSGQAVAEKDYDRLTVYTQYYKHENTAYFDGFSLYKETFGQSYAYDSEGNIKSATDLADKQSDFAYNANDDLIKLTTPKGNEFEYTYDSKHNVTGAESAKNIDYAFTYDAYGNNTSSKLYDNDGGTNGFIKTTGTYDANGNYLDTVTDARGKTTDYDFNTAKGTLTQVEDAKSNVVRYNYNSKLDRLNYVWLDLNENGLWDSNEPKNTYSYVGDRLNKVTVNGFDYDFDYDALGNLDIVKVGSQTLINNDYDLSKGLLDDSTYGNGDTLDYVYDDLDRVSSLNYDGGTTPEFKYFYDANGMIGYMVDNENGVEYRYLYDEANRPGSIVRDNGITSWYKYDDNINTPTTTEYFYENISAKGDTYETEYKSDEDGRPTSTIISVDGGMDYKVKYAYDHLNRPTSKKYYTGTTQEYKEEYTYLAGGQGANSTTALISQIEYNDSDTLSYTYDDVGNISTISDGTKVIQYYYDELNQLVRENNEFLGTSGKTIIYTYDNFGNILCESEYPFTKGNWITYKSHVQDIGWQDWVHQKEVSGTTLEHKRLEAMQIKLAGVDGGIEYRSHVQDIGWQGWVANGAVSGTTGLGKRIEAIKIQLTGQAASNFDVYYRAHVESIGWQGWVSNGSTAGTTGLGYRLEAIQIMLVPKSTPQDTINYTYDGTWKDKLASYDGKSITYDSIGNPLSYDDWTYTWKWGRRLATVGNTSKGISTSYKYNDSGIRTQKTVTDSGNTTTYKYNLMGSQITYEERTGANACEMYYAYDNAGKLYGFYYDGASNDGFYFYKRNLQGDIIGIINSSGTEVTKYIYDTWGKLVSTTGTLASTIGSDNPFRYRGYYYDYETGLYYLNQRYYNPEWGRFINADDLLGQTGQLLSHNVFAYCANNPVIYVDQSGRLFMLVAGLVGAVVGAVVGGAIAAATGGDILKGALIGGLTGGLMGLTCGAAASLVATGGATAFASTGVVMGTNTMLAATGSTVMTAAEASAATAMSAPKLFELGQKLVNYISKRGWSVDIINNTIKNPIFTGNTTNFTTGNPATAYFLSENQYVVIDNITRQLVQLSNLADAAWKVDSRIILEGLY